MTRNKFHYLISLNIISLVFIVLGSSISAHAEGSIQLYHADSKRLLAETTQPLNYQVLEQQGQWDIVQFDKPGLSVWVHSAYVTRKSDSAIVVANRLNARSAPSLTAPVLTVLLKNYTSVVISEASSFVQIYAPSSLRMALLREQSKPVRQVSVTTKTNTEWQYQNNNSTQNQKQPSEKLDTQQPLSSIASEKPVSIESNRHRLSPGDVISLNVFGEPDLSIEKVRIPESGVISFPLIGGVDVAKKNITQVENQVKQLLEQGYIKSPRLSITIDAYRPIFVKGAVVSSGSFPYTEGLTVAKALALAGGVKKNAKSQGVSIFRDDKPASTDLSIDSQYVIQSGDIVSVAEEKGVTEEAVGLFVYLHGEVEKPGAYPYRKGLTVEKAVVLAGGFSLRASKRKISLSRVVEGKEEPQKMKRVKLYLPVEPGDIIDVGASWF